VIKISILLPAYTEQAPIIEVLSRVNQHRAEMLSSAARAGKNICGKPISYFGCPYDEGNMIRPHTIFPVIWTMFVKRLAA
jgi:hypothetical protein